MENEPVKKISKTKLEPILSIVCVLAILAFLVCYELYPMPWHYINWQTINIKHVGTIKIPAEWVVTQDNRTLYITDQPMDEDGYMIYMVGTLSSRDGDVGYGRPETLIGNITRGELIFSETHSIGAGVGRQQFSMDDLTIERYFIDLYRRKYTFQIFIWDDSISISTVRKIAKSFDPEDPEEKVIWVTG